MIFPPSPGGICDRSLQGTLFLAPHFCVRTWLHYNKCRHAGPAQVGATTQFFLTEGTSSQNAEPFEMVQIRPASCFWKNFGVKNGVANAFWEGFSDLDSWMCAKESSRSWGNSYPSNRETGGERRSKNEPRKCEELLSAMPSFLVSESTRWCDEVWHIWVSM